MPVPTLEVYKTLWGVTEPLLELIPRLRSEFGYAGVEACLLYVTPEDRAILLTASQRGEIKLVIMLQTSGDGVSDHLSSLDRQLADAVQFRPAKINIHGGRDCYSFEESSAYFEGFFALQSKYQAPELLGDAVPLLHETHRGRILYSPWVSLPILKAFPSLLLTADLSHWVVVSERHLDCFPEVMRLVAERTRHIHTRPCSANSIQLGGLSLRSPEYRTDLRAFAGYWKNIFETQAKLGDLASRVSIDPELGPFPYAQLTPSGTLAQQDDLDVDIEFVVHMVREIFISVLTESAGCSDQ